jgi:3-isopropylmalate/(R)-2-methylmalate dehydratase small subunit
MYTDTSMLAQHVFENRFPGLASTFSDGDLIVADDTFGIGSSREQAVSSLLAAGVGAVIAPRFGRIFFRNAWNLGLLAIEAEVQAGEGEPITLDLHDGVIGSTQGEIHFVPPPKQMVETVKAGGLLAKVAAQLAQHNALREIKYR